MKSSDIVIGIVSADGPSFVGGMGRHVGALAEGFRKEGVTVHVYDRTERPLAWRLLRNIGFSAGLHRHVRMFASARGVTVLNVHGGPGGVLNPVFPLHVKTVVTANHTYRAQSRLPGQRWKTVFVPFERRMYEHADAIIAISEDTADSLQKDYGIPESRITVIHCGFDLASWTSADAEARDKNSCVFVGRPDARKGWDILQKAWPLVRAAVPDARLSVVGWDGEPRDGIRFLGRLPDPGLQSLVGSARVTVCPSRLEGFGLAAAESIAAGTPVVATNVAGLRHVVMDGTTGVLTDTETHSLAAGIITLLTDDARWNALHQGCRGSRGRFGIDAEIRAHLALISTLYS